MGCQASTSVAHVDVVSVVGTDGTGPFAGAGPGRAGDTPSLFHSKYSLELKLGQGGFSRVYSCKAGAGQEELAVKITDVRAERRSQRESAEAAKRAEREAAMLKKVAGQSHVVAMVDCLTDGRFHYIVMERGTSCLFDALARMRELTEQSLARVAEQMLLGVAGVHARGLTHFDVKPSNFMCFGEEATVKLCDLGLAEAVPGGSSTSLGVKGTAAFMSPEIISGEGVGAPTDVWSLGVSLYTLLVGRFPYMPARRDKELMKAAITSGVPEPSYHPAIAEVSLSPQVVSLLRALLCRDPAGRPSAAAALEHSWFTLGAEWKPQSLKAVLRCAMKVGAGSLGGRSRTDAVDEVLCGLQERARPAREAPKLSLTCERGLPAELQCAPRDVQARKHQTVSLDI